jgi:serine/threonine-protein kinase
VAELDDEDLRLLDEENAAAPVVSLRDLGDAEPTAAPMRKPPPAPVRALVMLPGERGSDELPPRLPGRDDSRWLTHFIAIAVALGVIAIILIALLQLS